MPSKKGSKKTSKRSKEKLITCKKCGFSFKPTEVEPTKTWVNVSPMPDKDGRVTITTMAVWKCPQCGNTIRGAMGKTKGEFEGKSKKEQLLEFLQSGEKVSIEEIAKKFGYDAKNVEKIITLMIKKGQVKGKIENGFYVPE